MRWELTLMMLPGLIVGLTFHEFAHAWSASLLGDDYARRQGRVSLNPLRHLSALGTFALLFLPIGWGKPVPLNLYNFRHPRRDYLLTSLAGPLANALLAGLCIGLMFLTRHPFLYEGWMQTAIIRAHTFLTFTVVINAALAIFNLMPIPPLDGSKIWPCLVPFIKPTFKPKTNLIFLLIFLILVFSHSLRPIMKYAIEGVMCWAPESDVTRQVNESIVEGNKDLERNRFAEAERHFSAGLALDPFSDPCYYFRAIAFLDQGKPKEALQDIDRAIEIDSRQEYYNLKAEILRTLGQPVEADRARMRGNGN
jgi:Zn-dependent protease